MLNAKYQKVCRPRTAQLFNVPEYYYIILPVKPCFEAVYVSDMIKYTKWFKMLKTFLYSSACLLHVVMFVKIIFIWLV